MTQSKELKHVRLHGKIMCLLDLPLKRMKVVVGHLNTLNISARGAHEVVVMVVGVKQFVTLHAV